MLPASSIALFFENIPLKIMIKNDLDCLETKSTEKDLICLLRNKINKEIFENLQIKSQIFKFKIMSLVEILFTLKFTFSNPEDMASKKSKSSGSECKKIAARHEA